MGQRGIDPVTDGPALSDVVKLQQERAKTLVEMAENSVFFYLVVKEYDEKAARKNLGLASLDVLKDMHQRLKVLTDWAAEPIHDEIKACSVQREIGMGKVAQPIRVAITGNTISPPLDATLTLLGRERTLSAIQQAIIWVEQSHTDN